MNLIPLGQSASVKVIIDPRAARREVDGLKREMTKLEETRKKFHEEVEHSNDGKARAFGNKPDPNSPAGKSLGGSGGAGAAAGRGGRDMLDVAGRAAGALLIARVVKEGLIAANSALKRGPAAVGFMRELLKDTPVGEYTNVLFQKDGIMAGAAQDAANDAMKRSAMINAAADTTTDVLDYNVAHLKLGGKIPDNQGTVIEAFYKKNVAERQFEEMIQFAKERDLLEAATAETVKRLQQANNAVFGR